jgi:hypothetical protein
MTAFNAAENARIAKMNNKAAITGALLGSVGQILGGPIGGQIGKSIGGAMSGGGGAKSTAGMDIFT